MKQKEREEREKQIKKEREERERERRKLMEERKRYNERFQNVTKILRNVNGKTMKKSKTQPKYNYSLGEILGYIDSLTEEGYIGNLNLNEEIFSNAVPVAGK